MNAKEGQDSKMITILDKGTSFIWENARLLDRVVFDYHFRNGSVERILTVLGTYQNEDGGFGHALEPDLRAPDSQPLFVEFALRTLYDCKIRAPEMTYRACEFLAQHADLEAGIPTIFPSSRSYPRAAHWHHEHNEQPSLDRMTSLVGLAAWQGIQHPWLQKAIEACLAHITSTPYNDAHIIQNALCLIESLSQERPLDNLFKKLTGELKNANFYCAEVPVKSYGLTPLEFAPSPESFCRRIFSDAQIEAHLSELEAHQEADGGWGILWTPPGEYARLEWRAHKTVKALVTLHAYRRI